jgi:hypothetical protein
MGSCAFGHNREVKSEIGSLGVMRSRGTDENRI